MAEPIKRGLRERPKKRNFDSDNDDGQLYPYIKNYSKEFINPSQQLNQDAKLLIKFINTVNRYYSQSQQHLKLQKQNETVKSAQNLQNKPLRKEENIKEINKKNAQINKTTETQSLRKGKEINSNNGQNKSYQKINNNKGEDALAKIKGMALASASSMLELQKTLGKNQANGSIPKKGGQYNSSSKIRSDTNSCFAVRGKDKNGTTEKQVKASNKFQLAEQKIFKRSAYHVAIAYHIFLSQKSKQSKGSLDNVTYDPTYPARKLKEQMNKRG